MMTPDERTKILREWAMLAAYFQSNISDGVLSLYTDDVAHLPFQEVLAAMAEVRKEKGRRFMPLPADVLDKFSSDVSPLTLANEVAGLICSGIEKFSPDDTIRAHAYIGELGWMVVKKLGGWQSLCTTLTNDDMRSFFAQVRELTKSQIELAKAGRLHTPPDIPYKEKNITHQPGLLSFEGLMKQIEEKK